MLQGDLFMSISWPLLNLQMCLISKLIIIIIFIIILIIVIIILQPDSTPVLISVLLWSTSVSFEVKGFLLNVF